MTCLRLVCRPVHHFLVQGMPMNLHYDSSWSLLCQRQTSLRVPQSPLFVSALVLSPHHFPYHKIPSRVAEYSPIKRLMEKRNPVTRTKSRKTFRSAGGLVAIKVIASHQPRRHKVASHVVKVQHFYLSTYRTSG